jgi:hypothetical protein
VGDAKLLLSGDDADMGFNLGFSPDNLEMGSIKAGDNHEVRFVLANPAYFNQYVGKHCEALLGPSLRMALTIAYTQSDGTGETYHYDSTPLKDYYFGVPEFDSCAGFIRARGSR